MGKPSPATIKKTGLTVAIKKEYRISHPPATGSQLHVCPFTGFLGFINPPTTGGPTAQERIEAYKQGGPDPFLGFRPSKKIEFLNVLPEVWPNLAKALKQIDGPDRNTLHAHMETDLAFRERIKEIEREKMDELKSDISKFAKRPKNFMDRMALGRIYDPEAFDPARRLIVEQRKSVDQGRIQSRITSLDNCIDAELVHPEPPPQPQA